jgi:hypothetical protein
MPYGERQDVSRHQQTLLPSSSSTLESTRLFASGTELGGASQLIAGRQPQTLITPHALGPAPERTYTVEEVHRVLAAFAAQNPNSGALLAQQRGSQESAADSFLLSRQQQRAHSSAYDTFLASRQQQQLGALPAGFLPQQQQYAYDLPGESGLSQSSSAYQALGGFLPPTREESQYVQRPAIPVGRFAPEESRYSAYALQEETPPAQPAQPAPASIFAQSAPVVATSRPRCACNDEPQLVRLPNGQIMSAQPICELHAGMTSRSAQVTPRVGETGRFGPPPQVPARLAQTSVPKLPLEALTETPTPGSSSSEMSASPEQELLTPPQSVLPVGVHIKTRVAGQQQQQPALVPPAKPAATILPVPPVVRKPDLLTQQEIKEIVENFAIDPAILAADRFEALDEAVYVELMDINFFCILDCSAATESAIFAAKPEASPERPSTGPHHQTPTSACY